MYVSVSVRCDVSRCSGHWNDSESAAIGSRSAPSGSARTSGRHAHRSQLLVGPALCVSEMSPSGSSMRNSSGHSLRRPAVVNCNS